MRNLILALLIHCASIGNLFSQYTEIQISYLSFTYQYQYNSSGIYYYAAPVNSITENALRNLQARYNYYHDLISKEYYKLKDLELVNSSNKSTLQDYKNARLNWVYNAGTTWDLSKSSDSQKILEYCCEIYNYPTIKNELDLLRNIYYELLLLENNDPSGYKSSQRYIEIVKVYNTLKTCASSDIGQLAFKYNLTRF